MRSGDPHLKRSHATVPEGQGVFVVLEPVGEVDGATSGELADGAAQRAVDVSLARHRKTCNSSFVEFAYSHFSPIPRAYFWVRPQMAWLGFSTTNF